MKARKESITKETCLKCGACCVAFEEQIAYCDITPKDAARLDKKFVRLNVIYPRPIDQLASLLDGASMPWGAIKTKWVEQAEGPLQGAAVCSCAALEGAVLHRTRCSVYEDRPRACRVAVKPGDKSCREIRRMLLAANA